MKEQPILFSTSMVQAILDGRKTQTRRIVKEPYQRYPCVAKHLSSNEFDFHYDQGVGQFTASPYGKPGDILWVRETWCRGKVCETDTIDPTDSESYVDQCEGDNDIIHKEAMISHRVNIDEVKWKPSIFMPKEACRIRLEITNIGVERVQDITEQDSIAEGIESIDGMAGTFYKSYQRINANAFTQAKFSYRTLWEKINGDASWNTNPWVWVIEFKRIKP